MEADIDFAGGQDRGARPYQEDFSGFADPQGSEEIDESGARGLVAILADGMGGHVGGAQASHIACGAFASGFANTQGNIAQRLRQALDASNSLIAQGIRENPDLNGMGCTLVGLLLKDKELHWISVGDSLLYLYHDGKLRRLNQDHSLASQIDASAQRGEISQEEAKKHPNRSVLISAVMGEGMELVDEGNSVSIEPDDWIILASDGIETLDEAEICHHILHHGDGQAINLVDRLLSDVKTKQAPHQDNITVMAIRGEQKALHGLKPHPTTPKTVPLPLHPSTPKTVPIDGEQQSQGTTEGFRALEWIKNIGGYQESINPNKTAIISSLALLAALLATLSIGTVLYLADFFSSPNPSLENRPPHKEMPKASALPKKINHHPSKRKKPTEKGISTPSKTQQKSVKPPSTMEN